MKSTPAPALVMRIEIVPDALGVRIQDGTVPALADLLARCKNIVSSNESDIGDGTTDGTERIGVGSAGSVVGTHYKLRARRGAAGRGRGGPARGRGRAAGGH